jgi:Uncharacterised nucleotidyltransferase
MESVVTQGSCFPSEEQTLLLRAALLEGEQARDSFQRWRRVVDPMALDQGSFRVLPRLARNLLRLGADDPHLDLWKGTYRRAFAANEILFRDVEGALRALSDAGIATLVLEGAALVAGVSDDSGLRPIETIRILVRPGQASGAFETLGAAGWRSDARFSESLLGARRGCVFVGPGGRTIDLQWYLLSENCYPGADDSVWNGARDGRLGPCIVHAPGAADQLLHTCIDGPQRGVGPTVQWVADAFVLCASGSVDWERLAAASARRRLALPVRTALRWIREHLDAPVPDSVLAGLDALPVTVAERRELDAKLGSARGTARLRVLWSHHARAAAEADLGRASTLAGFIPYVQHRWGVAHLWQLPAFILRRGLRRIRMHARIAQ